VGLAVAQAVAEGLGPRVGEALGEGESVTVAELEADQIDAANGDKNVPAP
jgi:hypothetical protein